jgi:hypothetical protein
MASKQGQNLAFDTGFAAIEAYIFPGEFNDHHCRFDFACLAFHAAYRSGV